MNTSKSNLKLTPQDSVAFASPQGRMVDHVATRARSLDFSALGLYLPNPDPVLKKAGRDIAVYSDLKSDAHVGGCIRRRKAAVLRLEWRLERTGASARTTKLCEEVLQRLNMRTMMSEILESTLFGWQPMEVIWTPPSAGAIVPTAVVAKPIRWFAFDAESQLRFLTREQPLVGERQPPRKFLVPTQSASYANPYGFADLSMCFWPTVFKRGGLKFWVTFTEKFGMPWVVGKTPRNTSQADQDALLDKLEAMVQDAVAVIPDDASIDLAEIKGGSGTADLYEKLLMFCRSEVAIALLGQNQSTEANSNRASATAGLEVAAELRDADARLVETTINELLRWVVDANDGPQASAPKFELFEQAEVDKLQAERDKILSDAGVRFTTAYWMRVYDLEDGDIDTTSAPVPQLPAVPAGSGTVNKAQVAAADAQAGKADGQAVAFADAPPAPQPDALDSLVDAELAQWQPMMDPLAAPLQDALDQAVAQGMTAEELLAKLPDLLSGLDADQLAQALTHVAFTARLGAAAGVVNE